LSKNIKLFFLVIFSLDLIIIIEKKIDVI